MDIRHKSGGFIIDEYITSIFKRRASDNEQTRKRFEELNELVLKKYGKQLLLNGSLYNYYNLLYQTSLLCWNAQEIVMRSEDKEEVYHAAKEAQRTNAERNRWIREIDKVLGEELITPLEKTYAGKDKV